MKRFLSLVIFSLIIAVPTFARADVELLVKAEPNWMEALPENQKARWTKEQRDNYDARSVVGDVIVARPLGWTWGREENLPRFVIIRVTGMDITEAKKFEDRLEDDVLGPDEKVPRLLKKRKWQVPTDIVDAAIANGGKLTVTRPDLNTKIKEKKKQ